MRQAFILGCGKCGSSSLYAMLSQHPEIAGSNPKECNFFNIDKAYARGLEWYDNIYNITDSVKVRLDASICYSLYDVEDIVCQRIKQDFPDAKFIYIARNPYHRMESIFRERHHYAFHDGLNLPFTLEKGLAYHLPMLVNSLYWQRTKVFRESFGEDRMLYLLQEDMKADPQETIKKCLQFLEVEDQENASSIEVRRFNAGRTKMCDRPLMRKIRSNSMTWKAFQALPNSVRNKLKPKLQRPASVLDMTWTPVMQHFMRSFFQTDVQKFLAAAGKPADFWGEEFIDRS